jgi:hypothetical protein
MRKEGAPDTRFDADMRKPAAINVMMVPFGLGRAGYSHQRRYPANR